jgi:RNA polymerase sigma factor (sigma-70 family)
MCGFEFFFSSKEQGERMAAEKLEVALVGRLKHGILYRFLREKGWTQSELARRLGVTAIEVSNWMLLKSYPKKEEVLQKLMELTGKSAFELFPQFMRESEWKKATKDLPKEFAFIRSVELERLTGGRRALLLPSPEEEYDKKELVRVINEILDSLPARQKLVLQMRYGLLDGPPRTQKEVGEILGMSRSAIGRIEKSAFLRIRRNSLKSSMLRMYKS